MSKILTRICFGLSQSTAANGFVWRSSDRVSRGSYTHFIADSSPWLWVNRTNVSYEMRTTRSASLDSPCMAASAGFSRTESTEQTQHSALLCATLSNVTCTRMGAKMLANGTGAFFSRSIFWRDCVTVWLGLCAVQQLAKVWEKVLLLKVS